MTDEVIAKISLSDTAMVYEFSIDEATLCELMVKQSEMVYLTIIKPNDRKIISIDSTSIRTESSPSDSLVNFLWKNGNEMFSKHYNVIFEQNNPEQVRFLYDSLIFTRSNLIKEFNSELSKEDIGILAYQNEARAYSFLFYYGRWMKEYPASHEFFNFIDSIDNEVVYTKTLPNNLLFKYEIQFLRENDSIRSIDSFLSFIERQTKGKNLQDYLKAIYIRDVIESPSYWKKHVQLFNSEALKSALEREHKNRYSSLIQASSNSFFRSQKGEVAFDFAAHKQDGLEFRLSDLKGKLVLIDTWATWCGPCIDQRPDMLKMAANYQSNPNIAFLMISVEKDKDKWERYIARTNPDNFGIELFIEDGMFTEFGESYFIKSIPKYILVDHNGIIIDSDVGEPSLSLEELIKLELRKIQLATTIDK